jgi:hypothetical protein
MGTGPSNSRATHGTSTQQPYQVTGQSSSGNSLTAILPNTSSPPLPTLPIGVLMWLPHMDGDHPLPPPWRTSAHNNFIFFITGSKGKPVSPDCWQAGEKQAIKLWNVQELGPAKNWARARLRKPAWGWCMRVQLWSCSADVGSCSLVL